MEHVERSSFEQAMMVQQKFDLLLSRQASAQTALLNVLTLVSASDPKANAVVAQVEAAMNRATDANVDLLRHLSDLKACFETIVKGSITKH
jgi:hypothetical protein